MHENSGSLVEYALILFHKQVQKSRQFSATQMNKHDVNYGAGNIVKVKGGFLFTSNPMTFRLVLLTI